MGLFFSRNRKLMSVSSKTIVNCSHVTAVNTGWLPSVQNAGHMTTRGVGDIRTLKLGQPSFWEVCYNSEWLLSKRS